MIGQSGKIIAPNLCIAIGVSGAAPLAAGIQQSKKMIAVNQDREAPIFKIADLGIVADYHEVLAKIEDHNIKIAGIRFTAVVKYKKALYF